MAGERERVMQTRFGERGNCFAACMASIFRIPLADAPECHGDEWQLKLSAFLMPRGLVYVEVPRGNLVRRAMDDPPAFERTLGWQPLFYGRHPECILIGDSPRGEYQHCVVGTTNGWLYEFRHDPHPSGEPMRDIHMIGLFVAFDPRAVSSPGAVETEGKP